MKKIRECIFRTVNCQAALLFAFFFFATYANAEMHLYWHWEGGGGGSCGPFCTDVVAAHIVIDGWRDDDLDTVGQPSRFPYTGGTGGRSSFDTKRKLAYPETPGKGCTLAQNVSGYRGLPAGIKIWKFYIDPSTPRVLQDAFRSNFATINQDQVQRSREFRFQESGIDAAQLFISPPGGIAPRLRDGDAATTHVRSNRDGSIRTSWTVVTNAPLEKSLADTLAAHEIGHTVGLDDDYGTTGMPEASPDKSYPTVMYWAAGTIAGQKIEPCTLAAIDVNVNR